MALKNNNFTLILFDCLLLASVLIVIVKANELEVDDESSFSYIPGAPDGPENWGNINPNWTLCGTGKKQSPINILHNRVKISHRLGRLVTNYTAAQALIRNRGHDIQVVWTGDAGGIVINDDEYKLQQCHWHTPSEHKLNFFDRRFMSMELHLVHSNSQGDIAVVGILFRLGVADPFLTYLSPFLQSIDTEGTEINLGFVDPWFIKFQFRGVEYYRYNGSLTSPPCSENVTWTIMKMSRTASLDQIIALRSVIHDGFIGNARPIQHSRRTVYLYQPNTLVSEI